MKILVRLAKVKRKVMRDDLAVFDDDFLKFCF